MTLFLLGLKYFLLFLLIFIVGYLLFLLLGFIIPIHRKFIPPAEGIPLHLSTNGMHTDFILPAQNAFFDWTKFIDRKHFNIDLNDANYLAFGWGDKAIYLDLPEWNQLTIKMALKTLFLPTPTILHVTAYDHLPTVTMKVQTITISKNQYLQLCQFILPYFATNPSQEFQLIQGAGYTSNDIFYHARGKYHAFATCNTWVNKGLKKIGVRSALWSPLDRGIFYQLGRI